MDSVYSRERIINDFFMLDNNDELNNTFELDEVNDLFNSDILFIPFYRMAGGFGSSDKLDIKEEDLDKYSEIKLDKGIKCYEGNEKILLHCSKSSLLDILYLGSAIISTVSGLITISDFLTKKYNGNPTTRSLKSCGNSSTTVIILDMYIEIEENVYKYCKYQGSASNLKNILNLYIDEMKEKIKKFK